MLAIRLARTGKINRVQFQVVLQEHTVAPGGRHVEILGSYDPHQKKTVFKAERVKYWLDKGAQASDTVYNLLISQGVITGEKRKVKMPDKKVEEAKPEENKTEAAAKGEENKSAEPQKAAETEAAKPSETEKAQAVKVEEVKPAEEPLAGQAKAEEAKSE